MKKHNVTEFPFSHTSFIKRLKNGAFWKTVLIGTLLHIPLILSGCTEPESSNRIENKETLSEEQINNPKLPTENSVEMQSLVDRLNKVVTLAKSKKDFMGNIAIMANGNVIYQQSIGLDSIEQKKVSTINSRYRIGSVSKTYTAVLILLAVEEGKLSLDDTLEKYYPMIHNASKITIRDLLQHSSGIPSYSKDEDFFQYYTKAHSREEMLDKFSFYRSDFSPQSKGEYSNTNYYLLGLILESIYQQPYSELISDKIAKPLKLFNTYEGNQMQISNNESLPYHFSDKGWEQTPQAHSSVTLGAGSLVSTAIDVASFYHALFNGQLLDDDNLQNMLTVKNNFGLGVVPYTLSNRQGYGHRGTIDAYKVTAIHFPADNVTLVVTSNASNDNINSLYQQLLKAYFNDSKIDITVATLEKFVGRYVDIKDPSSEAHFERSGSTLVHVIQNEFRTDLAYQGNGKFLFEQMYGPSILFTFSEDGSRLLFEQGDYKGTYKKIK